FGTHPQTRTCQPLCLPQPSPAARQEFFSNIISAASRSAVREVHQRDDQLATLTRQAAWANWLARVQLRGTVPVETGLRELNMASFRSLLRASGRRDPSSIHAPHSTAARRESSPWEVSTSSTMTRIARSGFVRASPATNN